MSGQQLLKRYKGGQGPTLACFRVGSRKRPQFQLVVRHSKGSINKKLKYIEDLGFYQAYSDARGKRYIRLKVQRCKYWIGNGLRMTNAAYRILQVSGLVPPRPIARKISLGEARLARYMHQILNNKGYLSALPEGIPAKYKDIMPGKLPFDTWTKDVLKYQYAGKL